jgi:hypothetical protein
MPTTHYEREERKVPWKIADDNQLIRAAKPMK